MNGATLVGDRSPHRFRARKIKHGKSCGPSAPIGGPNQDICMRPLICFSSVAIHRPPRCSILATQAKKKQAKTIRSAGVNHKSRANVSDWPQLLRHNCSAWSKMQPTHLQTQSSGLTVLRVPCTIYVLLNMILVRPVTSTLQRLINDPPIRPSAPYIVQYVGPFIGPRF